jgi:hypothetical protein
MASARKSGHEPSVTALVEGTVNDGQKLISQQFDLMRQEVRDELGEVNDAAITLSAGAGLAALTLSAGAGLAALAGVMSAHMLVHLLHRSTRMPLWGCYGVVAGAEMLNHSRKQAGQIGAFPQTKQTLKENAAWLRSQVTTGLR